ncbi:Cysteine dioxygenase type I [Streptomyces sp. DvalAA-14]|uniref:cysteine dioxygenase n=1 Tax=unclassified Streptomyces TaxID=2593676 RepID=UPI00081BAB17|nr:MULTISPECIES: cysteine dioxygenase [unclassified Streptomyces]MYS20583.1 cysteine dioxygenase [Streptomyces sp. SID4948]SCD72296.1 Cysteine dioxygenase type I [Streptomyces sp. DvalAA-14]
MTTPTAASTAGPTTAAPTVSPTAPTAADLLDFARKVAADHALVGELPLDPEGRTWVRLEGPGGAEAWLIGWPPGAETGWHDHGGSYGVFVTAAGELTESSLAVPLPTEGWRSLELAEDLDRERILPEGAGRAFGRSHVHQVENRSPTGHAVSVHAYYPPLPLIRRYSRKGSTLRLELVEKPEEW